MKIQKALEDYLEAMLRCKEERGYIRSVDVAEMVGVTKASVSYSTKRLREKGYITMEKDGLITITESGMEIAQHIYTRHKTLTELLMMLGVSEAVAREDACKLEHDLSEESFNAMCEHARKMSSFGK